ncbi:plasmid mobilization relaxosome protein MobC [Pseudomonas syringae group sp. J254-4]|uniref:plasmid mobilization relaxosome protein MobC n=1 Tax=Pseudomonas syringae group sp. J254-4 TaxID=3079589 RepID=UPI00290C5317|nr:plasmid mobilization relaxosome protein MobC [Pseudomonas syringae group sp. J254-4]MDU8458154.1 plasmid mobilization relaxosome protein MobC [Pseudomonas syringae group sp. J254-4]
MESSSRALNVHLGADLKARWADYCLALGKSPGAAIKAAIEQQLAQSAANPPLKPYQQVEETTTRDPMQRFEILLTASEKAAINERAQIERCSMRRWIVDAIRIGLTHEPQFGMDEIDALGESNYQLLALGRNLNQIARRMNEGGYEPVTAERIEALSRIIDNHTEKVSRAIRASIERWDLRQTPEDGLGHTHQRGRE